METVRDILAAHRSGISRPGILAWARLRIDPAMTEAQLEEELARLGPEVVDDEGFLYLRSNLEPGRLATSRSTSSSAPGRRTTGDERNAAPPSGGPPPDLAPARPDASGRRWPPSGVRAGSGGSGRRVGSIAGLTLLILWGFGLLGDIVDTGEEASPGPTPAGVQVAWTELAIGECFTYSEAGFGSIRRLPCDQPHGYEMIEIVDHPGATFPGEAAFASFVDGVCPRAFAAYTGAWPEDVPELTWLWWAPTEREWNGGVRTVACMLGPADGTMTDRSYRGGL